MIDPERIQRLAAKLGNRSDALEFVRQMRCGGKKYDGGGKYFRTNLQNESPMSYEPMMPVYPDVAVPERYYPQPNYGDYEYPESTGMIQAMPIRREMSVSVPPTGVLADEVTIPVSDLFSDEAIARRALKQRYAESSFNDRAVSKAGAQGAWQIMPITLKDYLGRGRGKAGDLNDPEYNRKVRDWVMGIIPRDLQEFWSEDDSDRSKLAKLYAAYNWGAGNLRGFLRKKQKAGVDISNPDNWVDDLNPETRRYVKYLAFDEDIPDSIYTNSAFENAARSRGYMAGGGKIRIKPENRGKFTALKKRTGHSASWFKAHGTPAQKKMAVFELNSRKWKHGDGGFINAFGEGGEEERVPWYKLPVRVPNMTGTATAAATSLRDIPLTDSTVGKELAVAGTAMLPLAPYLGHSVAVGIDTMGRMAMPSTFLKGVSYYAPKAAGALSAVSPWLDAGALSLWSAEAGKAAIDAKRQGRTGDAIGMGTLAALPIVMPLGMKAYQGMKNGLRMKPFEIGNVSSAELYDPIVGHSTAPPEVYLAEEVARENAEIARLGRETLLAEPTDLNFFNNKALRLMAEQGNAQAAAELAARPYEVENLGGGYMLKSLMRGNPLEKQISKTGTVNVNNVKALVSKGSKVEQAVVDKVLASEEFAGKKSIDYNRFRKAVQDELITYDRTPDTRWEDYGMDRLGYGPNFNGGADDYMIRKGVDSWAIEHGYKYNPDASVGASTGDMFISPDGENISYNELEKLFIADVRKKRGAHTYTFSSSRIPNGSGKHYDAGTLGHSRTYTTADEPDVLHVMESQSDWAQQANRGSKIKKDPMSGWIEEKNRIRRIEDSINQAKNNLANGLKPDGTPIEHEYERHSIEEFIKNEEGHLPDARARLHKYELVLQPEKYVQEKYLQQEYTSRQIQENLRYAAEKGQTKMRYPTRETAAKVEGYPGEEHILYFDENGNRYNDPLNEAFELDPEIESLRVQLNKEYDNYAAGDISARDRISELTDKITEMPEKPKRLKEGVVTKTITTYQPEHDGILKKYEAFPKQFKKLYKGADVRTVTDSKGNTWYEVDVPENYLQQEWTYEEGGSLILPKMMMSKHSPDKLRSAIASIRAKQKK